MTMSQVLSVTRGHSMLHSRFTLLYPTKLPMVFHISENHEVKPYISNGQIIIVTQKLLCSYRNFSSLKKVAIFVCQYYFHCIFSVSSEI